MQILIVYTITPALDAVSKAVVISPVSLNLIQKLYQNVRLQFQISF